jgi:hypothetical protein
MTFCEHAGVITQFPTMGTHWHLSELPMANDQVRSKHSVQPLMDQEVPQERPIKRSGTLADLLSEVDANRSSERRLSMEEESDYCLEAGRIGSDS